MTEHIIMAEGVDVDILRTLFRIESKVDHLIRSLQTMSSQVSQNFLALQQEVAATQDVEQSAVKAIAGIEQQLAAAIAAANNGDTNALPNLQSQLASTRATLAAAIATVPGSTPTGTNTSTGTSTSTGTDTSTATST